MPSFRDVVLVETSSVAGVVGRKGIKVFPGADSVGGELLKRVVAGGAERFWIDNDRHVSVIVLDVRRGLAQRQSGYSAQVFPVSLGGDPPLFDLLVHVFQIA